MKKLVGAAALVALVAAGCSRSNGSCSGAEPATDSVAAEVSSEDVRADSVPAGVRALLASYPDWIKGYSGDSLLMADGTAILYDDGREKDFVTMLDESDPEDMFSMVYREQTPPEYLADAGRSRCEALFKKMYGASAGEVRGHLVDVPWFGQTVKFTSVNGAADSLRLSPRSFRHVRSCVNISRAAAHSTGVRCGARRQAPERTFLWHCV